MRFDAGISSEYELFQIEAERATALVQQAGMAAQRGQQENALAVLLGRSPREIVEAAIKRGAPSTPAAIVVPAGLPSELLLRRPDIRRSRTAFDRRQCAHRRRPSGLLSVDFFDRLCRQRKHGAQRFVFRTDRHFSICQAILQPIFNAGRVGYQVDSASARQQQALAQYRLAIANAFRDVQDGLVSQREAWRQLDAEQARVNALVRAHEVVNLRYRNGTASFLEVLDAERNLLQAQVNRAEADRRQRAAVADLFKALGGGW